MISAIKASKVQRKYDQITRVLDKVIKTSNGSREPGDSYLFHLPKLKITMCLLDKKNRKGKQPYICAHKVVFVRNLCMKI